MNCTTLRCAVGALLSIALVACGGGTGDEPAVSPQATAADAPTFNLQAALNNSISDTSTLRFTVEAQSNGATFTGHGNLEQGALHTVSEFNSNGGALRKVNPMRMTLMVNNQPVLVESASENFYTRADLRLVGRIGAAPQAEFTEVTSFNPMPSAATVGSNGVLYTANRYADSGKQVLAGSTKATYTVDADTTAGSALLVIRAVETRQDNSPRGSTTTVFRVTQAGGAKLVSETTVDVATNTNVTVRYQ